MAQQHATPGQLLTNAGCHAILSTTDLKRARDFWENTCGLRVKDADDGGIRFTAGNNTDLYVYHREEPPKAENTVAGFYVDDLEATVNAMRNNGVTFEEYDMPGLTTTNGIASSPDGTWRAAWFKDPDGNTVAIGQWKS